MLYLYSKSKLPYILYYFFSKRREDRGLVFNILESQTFHFELGWANIEIIRAGKFLYRYQECLDPGPKSNIFVSEADLYILGGSTIFQKFEFDLVQLIHLQINMK